MDQSQYDLITEEYGNLAKSNKGFLTEISFVKYMSDYFKKIDKEDIMDIFEKLGYESDLTNKKLKVFTFSIYSSKPLEIKLKNSLKENYDSLSYQLQLRKLGDIVNESHF